MLSTASPSHSGALPVLNWSSMAGMTDLTKIGFLLTRPLAIKLFNVHRHSNLVDHGCYTSLHSTRDRSVGWVCLDMISKLLWINLFYCKLVCDQWDHIQFAFKMLLINAQNLIIHLFSALRSESHKAVQSVWYRDSSQPRLQNVPVHAWHTWPWVSFIGICCIMLFSVAGANANVLVATGMIPIQLFFLYIEKIWQALPICKDMFCLKYNLFFNERKVLQRHCSPMDVSPLHVSSEDAVCEQSFVK